MIAMDQLNDNQRQAVEWGDGALLVLAGPGSGKTTVLTRRIAKLIEESPDDNFRALGLTFTVKAANEMQNRIQPLIQDNPRRVQLRTFHSFCADLLRQHGSHLGLRPDFSVINDDKDRVAILKELHEIENIRMQTPEDSLAKIDVIFTYGYDEEDIRKLNGDSDSLLLIFNYYLRKLTEENQLDFGSMLYFTRRLLMEKPRIARQVRSVYRYVCVDEFQDTNLAQYKILKLITGEPPANLFVVADDDQILFQWNGADPKRLEELNLDYAPQIIQLPENYRCPSNIVSLANHLIEKNSGRFAGKATGTSHKDVKENIMLRDYPDWDRELIGLADEIDKIPCNSRSTCLVIARTNKLLAGIHDKLESRGIKSEIVKKKQDFDSAPCRLVYYALKLASSPNLRSVVNKLCSAASEISRTVISAEEVVSRSEIEEVSPLYSFFELLYDDDSLAPFAEKGESLLLKSMQYMKFIEESFSLFDELKNEDGQSLFSDYDSDKQHFCNTIDGVFLSHGHDINLYTLVQMMDLSPKGKEPLRDCVRLQTVHTAKGTEFENVFIVGLAEDQFPTYFAVRQGEVAIKEERRSCFVAITRSLQNLYLSYAHNYNGWAKTPSRFLSEMGLIQVESRP